MIGIWRSSRYLLRLWRDPTANPTPASTLSHCPVVVGEFGVARFLLRRSHAISWTGEVVVSARILRTTEIWCDGHQKLHRAVYSGRWKEAIALTEDDE